jgi:hypothetical protein
LTPRKKAVAASAVLVALAVCGWFEAAMRPFGLESSVVTFSVAAAVLAMGAVSDRRRSLAPYRAEDHMVGRVQDAALRPRGTVSWMLAVGFVVAVELWELFHGPRSLYPTLSSIANDVIGPGHRAARAMAFVCWGACGFFVSTRPGRHE